MKPSDNGAVEPEAVIFVTVITILAHSMEEAREVLEQLKEHPSVTDISVAFEGEQG